jgi:uncharacterized membrane protein
MIDFFYHTLEAIGFAHPVHPAITHLPMGMAMGGFIFLLGSVVLKKEELVKTAHYCVIMALLFVVPTMVLGLMDWQYKFDGEWSNLIMFKLILALIFCGLLVSAFTVGKKEQPNIKHLFILYGIIMLNAIGLGFIGGELMYG